MAVDIDTVQCCSCVGLSPN